MIKESRFRRYDRGVRITLRGRSQKQEAGRSQKLEFRSQEPEAKRVADSK